MPSNWLYIDTNFPTFTGEESPNEKITTIQNYMYMLVEQLRYSLHNLDLTNMNKTAVKRYETSLTEPIYARIEDDEGRIAQLALEAGGLALRLSTAEGNITQLGVTADGLALQISDAEDDILQLGITADALAVQIGDANGRISSLQQTVDSFALTVSNGSTSSRMYLTANGVAISSARISFTGYVTFSSLESDGGTTINGGNITTGTIRAITMEGNEIIGGTIEGATLRSVSSSDNGLEIYYGAVSSRLLVGGIKFDANGRGTADEAKYRMFIYTESGYADWAMKLRAAGGMSLESDANIYIEAATNLTMRAGWNIWINEPAIVDDDGNTWQFHDDGIYKNYTKVISLDA